MLEKILFLIAFALVFITLTWLDKKYRLGLGTSCDANSNDWGMEFTNRNPKQKDDLRERVEVLERIVTDQKYDLEQQIRRL